MGKPGIKLVLGAVAGFLVFMIMEPSAPREITSSQWGPWSQTLLTLLGVIIGGTLGGYGGFLQGSKTRLFLGVFLGALFGFIGAMLGAQIGNAIIAPMNGAHVLSGPGPIFLRIPLRILALTPIGILLGLGIGASSLSTKRATTGAIGGFLGALIGAALFDPISAVLGPLDSAMSGRTEVGMFGRAAYCILLGAGVGLFVGLVENYARSAWLRLNLGRNEGKEWPVEGVTVIGRGEMCQVPLFGDSAIAPKHATIIKQADQYFINDEGSQSGTYVNGQRITQSPLYHGAQIQIGSYVLEFLMRVGQAPVNAAEMLRSQQQFAAVQQGGAPVTPYQPGFAAATGQGPGQTVVMPNMGYPQPAPTNLPPMHAGPVGAPAQGAPSLIAVSGPLTGQRFPITSDLDVGREARGIALGFDNGASRRHASFSATPGGVIVTDLGSTNGTFVNDQKIQAATLSKGDTVRIGVTTFRVE